MGRPRKEMAGAIGMANIRINRGLKQQELADLLGTHESVVSLWERGRRVITEHRIVQLCALLKCSREQLLTTVIVDGPQEVVPRDETLPWELVCLLCSDLRYARGTDADALVTIRQEPRCQKCGGNIEVRRQDFGNIGVTTPSDLAVVQNGRAWRVVPTGRTAA